MELYHSLAGMVDTEITAADIPETLMAISDSGIRVDSAERTGELIVRIRIKRKYYRKLRGFCEKRGIVLRIIQRDGLYWWLKQFLTRPVLLLGMGLLCALILLLPGRVLFIRVEGNEEVPSLHIREAAEHCGIRFGTHRRDVRSERVKNALMQELPQLQWVGVNTYGCVAVISVRERSVPEGNRKCPSFGNIVAARSGIISSCTATRGTLLCQPGQAVTRGQILISGYLDGGIHIQMTGAQGEVYALTKRGLECVLPMDWLKKVDLSPAGRRFSLLVGKKRIFLRKDSGIWDTTCGRIYSENYITLPGGFQLPVAWCVDTFFAAETASETYPQSDGEAVLRQWADAYIRQKMIAGTVEEEFVRIHFADNRYRLTGEYVCTEMIGLWQAEQIGETNGKTD